MGDWVGRASVGGWVIVCGVVTTSHVKGVCRFSLPLPPMDQVEDSQFVFLWCGWAVTPHREGQHRH